jgi:hypothetical protein
LLIREIGRVRDHFGQRSWGEIIQQSTFSQRLSNSRLSVFSIFGPNQTVHSSGSWLCCQDGHGMCT